MTRPHALHLLACVIFIRLRQRIQRSTWPPPLFCTGTAHIRELELEENNEHSSLLKCLLLLDVWSDCVCMCVHTLRDKGTMHVQLRVCAHVHVHVHTCVHVRGKCIHVCGKCVHTSLWNMLPSSTK